MSKICYWSIGDGDYAKMISAMVHSARQVGIQEDFHVWTDRDVPNAITHPCGEFKKDHYLFKIDFLKDEVHKLEYDYFIFVDADSWFVRHPGDILASLEGAPVHICMESNCDDPNSKRADWWGCPLPRFCELMREKGVRSRKIFNCNAGFWIVHKHAIHTVHRLVYEFWHHCNQKGFAFTEEAPLSYVGHMMTGDPYKHQLRENPTIWASDWMGHFKDQIPRDEEWIFNDYMTMDPIKVKPFLVHAMRSKEVLRNFQP